MALSTSVGGKLIWTAEEDCVLLEAWKGHMNPSGKASDGFIAHLCALFPHRTFHAIRNHKNWLVRRGKFPRVRRRMQYAPLALSMTEAAWLSAMFEGEGSISDFFYKSCKLSKNPIRTVRMTLCSNSDAGVIRKVLALVPCAYLKPNGIVGLDRRGIRTNRTILDVRLTTQISMADFIRNILPYMAHEEKRMKCLRALEWLEGRLAKYN